MLEQRAEMARARIPDFAGDLLDLQRRIGQQLLGLGHAKSGQVFHKGCSGFFVETLTEVVRRQLQVVGNLGNPNFLHVVPVYEI